MENEPVIWMFRAKMCKDLLCGYSPSAICQLIRTDYITAKKKKNVIISGRRNGL